MHKTLDIYHQGAGVIRRAVPWCASVLSACMPVGKLIRPDNGMVLDIGAGSGRDALWFAEHGCQVIALEPAADLRQIGQLKTAAGSKNHSTSAMAQRQPARAQGLLSVNLQFNTILLSAWRRLDASGAFRAAAGVS